MPLYHFTKTVDGTRKDVGVYDVLHDKPGDVLPHLPRGARLVMRDIKGAACTFRCIVPSHILGQAERNTSEWSWEQQPERSFTVEQLLTRMVDHDAVDSEGNVVVDRDGKPMVELLPAVAVAGEPMTFAIGSDAYGGVVVHVDYQKGGSPRCDFPMRVYYVTGGTPEQRRSTAAFARDGAYQGIDLAKEERIGIECATRRPPRKNEQNRGPFDGPRYIQKGSSYGYCHFGHAEDIRDPSF